MVVWEGVRAVVVPLWAFGLVHELGNHSRPRAQNLPQSTTKYSVEERAGLLIHIISNQPAQSDETGRALAAYANAD